MKFADISTILLVLIIPPLIFLLALDYAIFDASFYNETFFEYGIQNDVQDAVSLNNEVINFLDGKSNELPSIFNERENQHLFDVRKIVNFLSIILYLLIFSFILLLAASSFFLKRALKNNFSIMDFLGRVMFLGGMLAVILAAALFFLIKFNFSGAFESFHSLIFQDGTYVFDPASEVIVRLYPEQFFIDIGARISGLFVVISVILSATGILLLKRKKIL